MHISFHMNRFAYEAAVEGQYAWLNCTQWSEHPMDSHTIEVSLNIYFDSVADIEQLLSTLEGLKAMRVAANVPQHTDKEIERPERLLVLDLERAPASHPAQQP